MRRALAIALLIAAACRKSEPVPSVPVVKPPSTLVERLQFEAANRTPQLPKAEQVFAALAKAGAPLVETKQFLGATADARYCAGGKTADGVAIAVCEYESAAAAEAGKRFVETRFANVPGRRIALHAHLTLTTTVTDPAPPSLAAIEAAFTNLKEGVP